MTSYARRWSEISRTPLTLEAIRELHVPSSHYRISPYRYKAGMAFLGTSKAGRLYVLSGACSKKVGLWQVALQAGMFADFPGGGYEFEVQGEQDAQLVFVWLIPEQYRVKNDA